MNAVVLAEIAPRFERIETLRSSLPSMAVIEEIPVAAAFLAGHAHAGYRRAGGSREAVLPDFLIGAHAGYRADRLLTRDRGFYRSHFPGLEIIDPSG